ncbi:MAG: HAMP domain-containing histidine kinase [Lachnospiraceae bacterium]|nr:HAMP domain-containing histidine kinase [Lachnospiraceae bacterium]
MWSRLKLGGRNLFYSMILAGCMFTFLVGYFVYMLPSLYVDYTMEQNLKSVREQHTMYVKTGSYEDVQVRNPTACFSVRIPDTEDSICLTNQFFSVKITVEEGQTRELFTEFRSLLNALDWNADHKNAYDMDSLKEQMQENAEKWVETLEVIFKDIFGESASAPFGIQVLVQQNVQGGYSDEYSRIHRVSDDFVIFETGVEDRNNQYINYIAVQRTGESLILTFLPVVTPDMNEIRPVVFQSLPMLGAVIFLLVLLFSRIYSGGIVSPIVRLVRHTEQMKSSRRFQGIPIDKDLQGRKDEIGVLAVTIDALYQTIQAKYEELAEKNQALAEENERQEVLLRASSHQLKTPISAALLLVDGMKSKIGRYQDTEIYLPKVKEQLLSMKKMVEDILYLNHCGESLDIQKIELRKVLDSQLDVYRIPIADKQLQVSVEGVERVVLDTDEALFSQILDNILSNVVNYTPRGERVQIVLTGQKLWIKNAGIEIDVDILPHILEPFVSGNHGQKENGRHSHGLGLYIAAYYARKIGMKIEIYNEGNSVMTVIYYNKELS